MKRFAAPIVVVLSLLCSAAWAEIDTIWAGTDGGGNFAASGNGTGIADGSYAYEATNKTHTYSNFPSVGGEKGVIDSVKIITRIYVSATQSNDNATLTPSNTGVAKTISTASWNSHVGSSNAGYVSVDITADQVSWLFADFAAGTQIDVANVKNQGPDGGNFYYDAFAFQIFYTPSKPVLTIDTAYQSSTDGTGSVTVQYDLSDVNSDPCKLTLEYSYDGATWYQAYIASASTGTVDNTGVSTGSSTGQITGIATNAANATFVWSTQNASNENGAFAGEDASVYVRGTPNDGTQNGDVVSSSAFTVDNQAPTGHACSTPTDGSDWPGPQPTLASVQATDLSALSYLFDLDSLTKPFSSTDYQTSGWQSADYDWTVSTLQIGDYYWWRVKARDSFGNDADFAVDTFDFRVSATRPNAVIDNAAQTSTDGTGGVTVTFDLSDPQFDACKLIVEYSFDNSTWYQAYINSSSVGTVDNTGVSSGSSSGQITGIATDVSNQTFVWDSKSASNHNGTFSGEDGTVWIRVLPNDGAEDGEAVSSLDFALDNQAPTGHSSSSPADGATNVVLSPLLTANAATDQSTVEYYFELASDVGFSTAVQQSGWQSADSWTPTSPLNGNVLYYWHVRSRDAYGNTGSYATTFDFTTTDGWEYPTAGTIGPCVAPSLGNGVVYVGTGGTDDKLYCISTTDGSLNWSVSLGADAMAVSSAYDESAGKYTVYVAISQNVNAYWDDGASASSRWSRSYGSPARDPSEVIATPDMNNVYYAYNGSGYKVSNSTGSDAAGWPTAGVNASQASSPIVDNATVYFPCTDGQIRKYLADGTVSGNRDVGQAINTPLGGWNGYIYAAPADNFIYNVEMSTMTLLWTSPTLGGQTNTGVFSLGDGYLYVGAGSTVKQLLDSLVVTGDTASSVEGTYTAGGTVNSTPISNVSGSQIYFGCDDNSAYGITSSMGNIAGYPKTDAGNTLPNTPAVDVSSGIVVYTSTEGKVYGYAMQ